MDLLLKTNHGVVSRPQLLAADLTDPDLKRLVRNGRLTRIRTGWYHGANPDPAVLAAVRAGGVLSCVSALREHGLWIPPGPVLHLRRSRWQAKNVLPQGLSDCGRSHRSVDQVSAVDPLLLSFEIALGCCDPETCVVLLDSALNRGLVSRGELVAITGSGALLDRVDGRAESGTETYVRLRLRRRGIEVRLQVQIGAIGRVDLLVGDRLVIEVDSRRHHQDAAAYACDRERDRLLVALGYVVIRLTYEDVLYRWEKVEADITALIRAGRHRWPRSAAVEAARHG